MAAKHVVFTMHAEGEDPGPPGEGKDPGRLHATPPNVVVDLGAGDSPLLKFTNLAGRKVHVEMRGRSPFTHSAFEVEDGASRTLLFRPDVELRQYEYVAYCERDKGKFDRYAKGASSPGIIITD